MTRATKEPRLTTEFDEFLFARIGEDGNGTPLSVVSGLARVDVDPWQEAAELARLPVAAAERRLTTLLTGLPAGTVARSDLKPIAGRLIALLPHQADPPSAAPLLTVNGVTIKKPWVLAIYATVMIGIVTAQLLTAVFQSPARPEEVGVSTMASSRVSAPRSGR
jgi:hypothetical protein